MLYLIYWLYSKENILRVSFVEEHFYWLGHPFYPCNPWLKSEDVATPLYIRDQLDRCAAYALKEDRDFFV
jgi:hypothetical protein